MPDRKPQAPRLKAALGAARSEYLRLLDEIDRVVSELRGPSSAGSQRVGALQKQLGHAHKRYWSALEEFADFVLGRQAQPENTPQPHLTPREREVLILVASGKSSKEISATLGVTFKTVVVHRQHLHTKLKLHTSADLVRAAIRMGLIAP